MSHLHIVSFNVPWPADYGGVIDVYERIAALHRAGIKIHLHCYTYGRPEAQELEALCEEVCYYRRATGFLRQVRRRPYIVASRTSRQLVERLRRDHYPILLEGLHDCHVLEQLADGQRAILVRAHNVEHDYYRSLAAVEPRGWKRLFFLLEAAKLKRYEPVLRQATAVLAISQNDAEHFSALGCPRVELLPPSHGHGQVCALPGRGDYILYHGNLSVAENIQAVRHITEHLIESLPYTFVVAGRNPDSNLAALLARHSNARLIANPDDAQMRSLIAHAHINLLVTEQATGVKLKLMNALYQGRFCVVNPTMVEGTRLAAACTVADTPQQMRDAIAALMRREFTSDDLAQRKAALAEADTADAYTIISRILSSVRG